MLNGNWAFIGTRAWKPTQRSIYLAGLPFLSTEELGQTEPCPKSLEEQRLLSDLVILRERGQDPAGLPSPSERAWNTFCSVFCLWFFLSWRREFRMKILACWHVADFILVCFCSSTFLLTTIIHGHRPLQKGTGHTHAWTHMDPSLCNAPRCELPWTLLGQCLNLITADGCKCTFFLAKSKNFQRVWLSI